MSETPRDDQKKVMSEYLSVYGGSVMGLTRIITKVYVRRMFRNAEREGTVESHLGSRGTVIGDSQLTGLNEFG